MTKTKHKTGLPASAQLPRQREAMLDVLLASWIEKTDIQKNAQKSLKSLFDKFFQEGALQKLSGAETTISGKARSLMNVLESLLHKIENSDEVEKNLAPLFVFALISSVGVSFNDLKDREQFVASHG